MGTNTNEQGKLELTPDEARMVIKAIEEIEREEAESQGVLGGEQQDQGRPECLPAGRCVREVRHVCRSTRPEHPAEQPAHAAGADARGGAQPFPAPVTGPVQVQQDEPDRGHDHQEPQPAFEPSLGERVQEEEVSDSGTASGISVQPATRA